MKLERILAPTDFSPAAEKALHYAMCIAARSGAAIVLYHGFTPVVSAFVETAEKRKIFNAETEAGFLKKLERLKKKMLADHPGVAISTVVGRAPLIRNLLDFAANNNINMIVMGTQGASGLRKVVIGSVASRVMSKSKIPVLLVPEKSTPKDPARILFAAGYTEADQPALSFTLKLAEKYSAAVSVVHLLSAYTIESEKENEETWFEKYTARLQKNCNYPGLHFKLLRTDSIVHTMENLHKKVPYDMVVMVRRKRSLLEKFFWQSFTTNMAYITKYPLLIIPEKE